MDGKMYETVGWLKDEHWWMRHLFSHSMSWVLMWSVMAFFAAVKVDQKIAEAIRQRAIDAREVTSQQNAAIQKQSQDVILLSEQLKFIADEQRARTERFNRVNDRLDKLEEEQATVRKRLEERAR